MRWIPAATWRKHLFYFNASTSNLKWQNVCGRAAYRGHEMTCFAVSRNSYAQASTGEVGDARSAALTWKQSLEVVLTLWLQGRLAEQTWLLRKPSRIQRRFQASKLRVCELCDILDCGFGMFHIVEHPLWSFKWLLPGAPVWRSNRFCREMRSPVPC